MAILYALGINPDMPAADFRVLVRMLLEENEK